MSVSNPEDVVDCVLGGLDLLSAPRGRVAGVSMHEPVSLGIPLLTEANAATFEPLVMTDVTWKDVGMKVDVSLFSGETSGLFQFHRHRSVPSPRSAPWHRIAIEWHFLGIQNGRSVSARMLHLSNDGASWKTWRNGELKPPKEEDLRHIKLTPGLEFSRRLSWHVALSNNGSQFVSLRTDPIGAAELLRLRDVPAGKSRRAALVHWVSEHHRKGTRGGDDGTLVGAYLRGEGQCTWNGLRVKVLPSDDDIAKYKANHPFGRWGK